MYRDARLVLVARIEEGTQCRWPTYGRHHFTSSATVSIPPTFLWHPSDPGSTPIHYVYCRPTIKQCHGIFRCWTTSLPLQR